MRWSESQVRSGPLLVVLVLAAVVGPADVSAGRPRRSGRFAVDRGRVRFHERIRSRHRFVVHHDQGSGDVSTTVRSGKLLRKGLRRQVRPTPVGGGTESTGEYFREGPAGVAHVVRGTDHIVVRPGDVQEEVNRKPLLGRAVAETRSTVAGAGGTTVEATRGDRAYRGLDLRDASVGRPGPLGHVRTVAAERDATSATDSFRRDSLLERFTPTIFGESAGVDLTQMDTRFGLDVSRETSLTRQRWISRLTEFHPGGVSTSLGQVEKHGRVVRRDEVRVTDRDGHRVERFLRRDGRERKRIETWAGRDGVTTIVITRYRRNGTLWMKTTLRTDLDGRTRREWVRYRRDGVTPRPPLHERP
jgi:hypothetical protein